MDATATGFSQQLRQSQRRQFPRHEDVKRIDVFFGFAHALEPRLGNFQKRIGRGPQLGTVGLGTGTQFQPERLLPGKVRVLPQNGGFARGSFDIVVCQTFARPVPEPIGAIGKISRKKTGDAAYQRP